MRGHGIFDDDMSAYLNGGANMINLYSVMDFYASVGIRPVVELSFMPSALASDPTKTIMHYRGGTSSPRDPSQWAAFITEVVSLFVERYGIDEVRQWPMEVSMG